MPREYRHISQYAKEIYELREQGINLNEIGKKLGFTHEQVRNFIHGENRNHRKLEAGIALKRKGRPPKDYVVSEQDKVSELKYILASKDKIIRNGKWTDAGFSLAHRKEVRTSVKYMVIYRHKEKY